MNKACEEIQDLKLDVTHVHHIPNDCPKDDCKYLAFKYITTLNVWPRQDLAFKDVDRLHEKQIQKKSATSRKIKEGEHSLWSKEPRLFAFEYNNEGKRKYISAHLGRFINFYWRECDAGQRHYYELIRENTPCRLYFDIEYSKEANPSIDDEKNEQLLDEFFEELVIEIQNVFQLSIRISDIIDLDSSTDTKFSRHVIVHMPNKALFQNNVQCGVFVKNFVSRLAEEVSANVMKEKGRHTLQEHFFVQTRKISGPDKCTNDRPTFKLKSCIVDLGVYTRNRIFRIIGSTKFGKPSTAALKISAMNKFPFPDTAQCALFKEEPEVVQKVKDISTDKNRVGKLEEMVRVTSLFSNSMCKSKYTFILL